MTKAEDIDFILHGVRYHWDGNMGSIMSSRENRCKVGELRLIAGRIFYVFAIYDRWFSADHVCWCCEDAVDHAWICAFKTEILGGKEGWEKPDE